MGLSTLFYHTQLSIDVTANFDIPTQFLILPLHVKTEQALHIFFLKQFRILWWLFPVTSVSIPLNFFTTFSSPALTDYIIYLKHWSLCNSVNALFLTVLNCQKISATNFFAESKKQRHTLSGAVGTKFISFSRLFSDFCGIDGVAA